MATINGTSAANLILGTNENDIVSGLGGNDVFQDSAAASDDLFDGGIGNDTINYVNATGAVAITLALDGVAQFTGGAGTDTLISVENATGSAFNDLLVGSNGINILNGGLGDDILDGGLGNDVLYGGGGNDTYVISVGSGEDDILDSGGTNDVLLIQGNLFDDVWDMWRQGNNLFVQMSNGTPQGGEIVVLFNHFTTAGRIETITDTDGNTFNLTNGTAGSAGNDVMVGGSANETFNGFGGDDVIQADLGHDTASGGLGNDVIYGLSGNDTLNGDDGNDLIYGDHGNDTIRGGAGDDVLIGGAPDDVGSSDTVSYSDITTGGVGVTVSLAITTAQDTGGAGIDTISFFQNITGSAFNDVLTGDGARNILKGEAGDDRLTGGEGNDTLDGGAGNDTATYESSAVGVRVNIGAATMFGISAGRGIEGTGAGATTDTLTGVEHLVGSDFNDVLVGSSAAAALHNVIDAGDGDDEVFGGLGNDTLIGGSGNDTVRYDGTAAVTVNLLTGLATGGAGTDTLDGFENIVGSNGADRLTGDGGDNILTGNAGNDVLDGGAGNDTAVYSTATAAVTVNLVAGTASGGAGADTLISIENAIGSNFADTFIVNGGDNVLDGGGNNDTVNYVNAAEAVTVNLAVAGPQDTGGAGTDTLISIENATGSNFNDVLIGNAGINVLSGGAGDDRLFGSLGNDRLDGGTGIDTADYSLIGTGVTVSLALGTAQNTVGAGFDTLVANTIENLVGTGLNDRLTGNTGNNVIEGGAGSDIMDGGAGIDTASYETAADGVTVNLALTTAQDTFGAGTDTLTNFENLTGSAFNDVLTSNGNANVLSGLAGDDTLGAGGGNDTLSGGAGNDTLLGGTGNDAIDGGADIDTASYADIAGDGVTVSLAIAAAQDTGAGGVDTLNSVENLTGSGGNDHLTGNAGENVLDGGAGNDTLIGGADNDTGLGGLGDDTYTYTVGDGDDIVNDEGGTDELLLTSPALGSVTNAKWTGNDLVITFTDDGTVTVQDHFAGTGRAVETGRDSTNAILNLATSLVGGAGNDLVAGTDGGETADGGAGDDVIFANDGDDTVIGGADDDILFGGRGNDTYQYSIGDGVDLIREHNQGDLGAGDDEVFFADTTFDGLDAGVRRDGDDLVIDVFDGGQLRLQDHFADHVIETARDSSGEVKYLATTLDGGANNDVVADDDDSETLTGGDGDDVLFGNGGNDTLVGGTGNDDLFGGSGNDTYRFQRGDGHDVISDDGVGDTDTLVLVSNGGLTSAARVGNDLVIGLYANTGSVTDENHYAGGTLERIVFERGLTSDGTPFDLEINNGTSFDGIGDPDELFVGTAADETFTLGDGHDIVFAGAGNDTIDGGTGDDWIEGGAGADHIIGGADGGFVWVADVASYRGSSAGVTIDLQADTAFGGDADGDNLDGIEGLAGSQFDDVLRGGVDDGREVFFGGGGNDTIDGRTGMDRVDYRGDIEHAAIDLGGGHVFTGVYVNLATGVAYDGFGATDSLTSIEQVVGSDFNDVLLGGNPASDAFELFRGREGDDIIDGGAGFDEVDYATSIAGISADLGTGVVFDGFGFTDTVTNIEAINGGLFADTMQGSDAVDETFRGLRGNDTIDGGASLGDAIDYRQDVFYDGFGAVTVNLATGTAIDGFGHTDTLSDIEVVFGTQFADTLSGSDADETFIGGAGNDVIAGGLGNDTAGYTGGAGITGAVTVDLNVTTAQNTFGAGTDTLTGIENLTGSLFADRLIGNAGDNILDGGAGNDTLIGGAGNDSLLGGLGDDIYHYALGDGEDVIAETAGAGGGDDEIELDSPFAGNLGTARRSGNDLQILFAAGGSVAILDHFAGAAVETARDSASVEYHLAAGDTGGANDDLVAGTDGDDTLDGAGGNDLIFGNAGNDSLAGGLGDDDLRGGLGDDTYQLGTNDGNDLIREESGAGSGDDEILINVNFDDFDAIALRDLDDLLLAVDGGGSVRVSGHYAGQAVETIRDASGEVKYFAAGFDGGAGNDVVAGTNDDDTLTGGAGDDIIFGNGGNDVIDGGPGNDELQGGVGDDRYVLRRSGGSDTISDEGGSDTLLLRAHNLGLADVRQSGSNLVVQLVGGATATVESHYAGKPIEVVEILTLPGFESIASHSIVTGTSAVITGTAANEIIIGDDDSETITGGGGVNYVFAHGGNDAITGGSHDDFIDGGAGNDTIDGGGQNGILAGGDFAFYANSPGAVAVNLSGAAVTVDLGAGPVELGAGKAFDGFGDTDTLIAIEGVVGSIHNDILIGRSSGNDRFVGNAGDDTISGLGGFDQVEYADSPGAVAINLSGAAVTVDLGAGPVVLGAGQAFDGFGATDTLTSIEGVRGGTFDDVLIGSDRTDVVELFRGRSGNNVIDGSGGLDEAQYNTSGIPGGFEHAAEVAPVSVNLDTVEVLGIGPGTAIHGGGFTDTLLNIEHLEGSLGDDILIGSAANNLFRGLRGNDYVDGRGGDEDSIDYRQDVFFGGGAAVTVDLVAGTAIDGFGDTDTLTGIEGIFATAGHDTLLGSNGSHFEFFFGGAGNDVIDGGGGLLDQVHYSDAFFNAGAFTGVGVNLAAGKGYGGGSVLGQAGAGLGTDTLIDIEWVVGSNFNDILIGDGGSNRLRGLLGDDILDGGAGIDEADYAYTSSAFFATTGVTVDLSIAGPQNTVGAGSDTLIGIENLRGTNGADDLRGDFGDNRIRGLAGNDVLDGGAGFGDLLDYSRDVDFGGTEGVTVNFETGQATDGFGDDDTIANFELLHGTQFDDTFTGRNSTAVLEAFRGLAGNDIINGGTDQGDEARYSDSPDAVTINLGPTATLGLASGQVIDGWGSTDTLTSIESVEGTAFNDIIIAGNPANDAFERLRGFEGDDYLDGGTGFDEVDYARLRDQSPAFAPVTVDLSIAGPQDTGNYGSDTLVNIEAIRATMGGDVLTGNGGNNRFRSLGGNDTIDGGLGNDTVDYSQDVNFGGFGGVNVDLASNTAVDSWGNVDALTSIESARGTNFTDFLTGDANANQLVGLGGDDAIAGGAGADILDGGAGDLDTVSYADDAAHGGAAGVTVNLASGFAIDGFGTTDTLSGFEVVIGTDADDILIGTSTREFFAPGLGNDAVDGGTSGADVLVYDDVGAAVTVNLAATTAQDTGGAGTDTLANINNVRGTAFDDRLTGNSNDNRFWGLQGNDVFDGGVTGDDIADYGLDALYGGAAGVSIDLRTDTAIDGFGDTDTLTNIRSVIGTGADDTIVGSNEVNRLDGSDGDDYLAGLAGWDELHAEGGTRDVLDYSLDAANGGTSGVVVDLGANTARDGWGDTDSLRGFEVVIATQYADTLIGSDDASVVERFLPGAGIDSIDGRGGIDVIDYSHGNAGGVTVNLDGGYAIDWTGATDDLFGVENVIGTDFDDLLLGDDWDNVIRGDAGNDTINGGDGAPGGDYGFDTVDYAYYDGPGLLPDNIADQAVTVDLAAGTASGSQIGNDTLLNIDAIRATMAADTLTGNDGDNVFIGLAGNDAIAGGLGVDRVDYWTDTAFGGFFGVSVDLSAAGPNASDAFGDVDSLTSIEEVYGTDSADTIIGGAEANTFDGRGGDDILEGGGGNDTLTGGWGNDTFVFEGAFGDDVITDFQAGTGTEDRINLETFAVDFDDLTFTQVGSDTRITSAAFGAGNTITLSNVQAVRLHEDDFIFQGI